MKTKLNVLLAVVLLASACTTGSKVTSGGLSDDLYFTPGDARPTVQKVVKEAPKPQKKSTVLMQVEENEQGKVVDNYIVPKNSRGDKNAYYFEDKPAYSDTTFEYVDNQEQVTINNYYEGEELGYAARIRTFYNPYLYDPFWDPYWGSGWGMRYGGGYGGYGGYYGGWGGYSMYSPWSYGGGWYDPFYSGFGWGFGYSPYYSSWGLGWGGGYYNSWGWGGGGYGFGYGGLAYDSKDYHHGMRNYTGRRGESNAVNYGAGGSGNLQGANFSGSTYGRGYSTGSARLSGNNTGAITGSGSRQAVQGAVSSTRLQGSRGNVEATRLQQGQVGNNSQGTRLQQGQATGNFQGTRIGRGETISNLRRSNNVVNKVGVINQGSNVSGTRQATTGQSYTPTYTRPRLNTQPSYNSGSTRQYSQPTTTGSAPTYRYSRSQSSGSEDINAVRSQPSVTYQRGSVGSSTYSRPSSGSSGSVSTRSYEPSRSVESSAPSRTFSSPSINSGSSGGSFGGGSSSGGGGGSRSSGGGGGSSGRQR